MIYLSLGLSVILIFIGIKLLLTYFHEVNSVIPKISTNMSLAFIALVLIAVAIGSAIKVKRDPGAKGHVGRLTDAKPEDEV